MEHQKNTEPKEEEKKNKTDALGRAALSGAAAEVVSRYGSASKEYLVAYSGVDNETGKVLQKSLKSIAGEKVNPEYKSQNLKQQAGFSAEVQDVANTNAENIINKDSTRKVRTDDVGQVNDPLYDTYKTDAQGNIIPGSGTQMKFVGGTPEEALKKIASNKFEKYLENDVPIEVPSDFYDDMMSQADEQIKKLNKQLEAQKKAGNSEQIKKINDKIAKYEKIKKSLVKSSVSNKEAMFARQHPKLATAKNINKVSHRAGMESAKYGAIIGGSTSLIRNFVSIVKGEEELEDAAVNVVKDTGKAAIFSYGTGYAGSAVKAIMQNAKSEYVRALSKTNIAGTVVNVAVTATKVMSKYFSGEIDGLECMEQLGQEGYGMVASAMFATIGQVVIPIPVVGGMIGSMLGYAVASASYGVLTSSLKEAKLAKEERERIEKECEDQIKLIREYRLEMEQAISQYMTEKISVFQSAFDGIKSSLEIGDVDGFIAGANTITKSLGKEVQFENMEGFNEIMGSELSFKL